MGGDAAPRYRRLRRTHPGDVGDCRPDACGDRRRSTGSGCSATVRSIWWRCRADPGCRRPRSTCSRSVTSCRARLVPRPPRATRFAALDRQRRQRSVDRGVVLRDLAGVRRSVRGRPPTTAARATRRSSESSSRRLAVGRVDQGAGVWKSISTASSAVPSPDTFDSYTSPTPVRVRLLLDHVGFERCPVTRDHASRAGRHCRDLSMTCPCPRLAGLELLAVSARRTRSGRPASRCPGARRRRLPPTSPRSTARRPRTPSCPRRSTRRCRRHPGRTSRTCPRSSRRPCVTRSWITTVSTPITVRRSSSTSTVMVWSPSGPVSRYVHVVPGGAGQIRMIDRGGESRRVDRDVVRAAVARVDDRSRLVSSGGRDRARGVGVVVVDARGCRDVRRCRRRGSRRHTRRGRSASRGDRADAVGRITIRPSPVVPGLDVGIVSTTTWNEASSWTSTCDPSASVTSTS